MCSWRCALALALCVLFDRSVQAGGFQRLDLLVTDTQNDRVLVIDPQTGIYEVLSPPAGAQTNLLNQPLGITAQADGTLWVVNWGDNNLVRIDPLTGEQFVPMVYVPGIPIGHFEPLFIGQGPTSVVADGAGDLFVASNASSEIRRVTGLGTPGVNSVQLVQDAALQFVSNLVLASGTLEVAARLTGVWEIPAAGGALTQRIGPVAGRPLLLAGVTGTAGGLVGAFVGQNAAGGACELGYGGVYALVHFQPTPGGSGYDDWVVQSANDAGGLGPYACPTSIVAADDTTFFVGQYDNGGGWVSKVVTGPQANVTTLATLPDGPGPAYPGGLVIAPVTVPEPAAEGSATAVALVLVVLARRRSRGR